jgi:hypothetical protein
MSNLLSNGQFHEAILPLPNCRFNSGCRSVVISAQDPKKKDFNLNDEFFISGNVRIIYLTICFCIPKDKILRKKLG